MTALDGTSDLSLDSTVEDFEAGRDEISSAWSDYEKAADELGEVTLTQVEDAYQDYLDAVDQISEGTTVADAASEVIAAADAFWAEVDAIAGSVTCE